MLGLIFSISQAVTYICFTKGFWHVQTRNLEESPDVGIFILLQFASILFKTSTINKAHFETLILDTTEPVYEV